MDSKVDQPAVTVIEVASQLRAFANNLDHLVEIGASAAEIRSVVERLRAYASRLDGAVSPDLTGFHRSLSHVRGG